jgi:NDP-sugar pyrophosphorylase family protein
MHGLVLCAGFGTRLRPLTSVVPKPAVPVGEIPAALRNVEQLLNAGFELVHCNTHYLAEELERQLQAAAHSRAWPAEKIRFWNEPEILETGGGIGRIIKACSAELGHSEVWDTVVVSGDIVADIPLERMLEAWTHRSSADAALMASLALNTPRKDVTWVDASLKYVMGFGADCSPESAATQGWHPRVFSNHQILSGRILARSAIEKRSSIDLFYRHALKLGEKILHIPLDDADVWFDIGTPETYFDCISKLDLRSSAHHHWTRSVIHVVLQSADTFGQTDHPKVGLPSHAQAKLVEQDHAQACLATLTTTHWQWLGHLQAFPEVLLQRIDDVIYSLEKKESPVGKTSGLFLSAQAGSFLNSLPAHGSGAHSTYPPSSSARRGFIDIPLPQHLKVHPLCQNPLFIPLNLLLGSSSSASPHSEVPFWLLLTPQQQ